MDYEKKYKEVFRRAKEKYAMFEGMKQGDVLEDIFPELKESDDVQIRKALIQNLKERFGTKGTMGGILDMPKVIAWLEKQGGEQNLTLPKWKYKNDNTPLLRDSIILNKYGCVAKSPSGALVSDVWVMDYAELAKLPKEECEKQEEPQVYETEDGEVITYSETNGYRVEQKPAEWSEDDDYNAERLLCLLTNEQDNYPQLSCDFQDIEGIKDWLKSIKDRYAWKPSDEQMYALEKECIAHSNYELCRLLEQLKKLREE